MPQRPRALDVESLVEGLVTDLHVLIVREQPAQAHAHLLRRQLLIQHRHDHPAQQRQGLELERLRARPGLISPELCQRGTVMSIVIAPPAVFRDQAVTSDLAEHRRAMNPQARRDLAGAVALGDTQLDENSVSELEPPPVP